MLQALSRQWKFIYSVVLAVFFLNGTYGGTICAQVRPIFRQDTLTVCFMGDIMMHTKQIETARKASGTFDFSSYFSLIEDRIKSADLAVANMEFTLAGEPYTGYPCFSAPDSYATYLADVGFDIFLAANNHILDKESKGAERTAAVYRELKKERGILFTGLASDEDERAGNYPLTVRRKGISLAFLNFTYGTNLGATEHWPKTNYLGKKEEVTKAFEASQKADVTIALPHWGPEYQLTHSDSQEERARWMVDNGADIIIGAHPHVIQDTTSINGVPVIYSLGNAVSNMSAKDTQLELMATVRIVRHGNGDITVLPIELTWLWCSRPGGYSNDYTIIPVEEHIGHRDRWTGGWEYDKMMETYERIRKNK